MDSFLGIALPDVARQILSVVSSGSKRQQQPERPVRGKIGAAGAAGLADKEPQPAASTPSKEGLAAASPTLRGRQADNDVITLGMKMMTEMLAEEEAIASTSPQGPVKASLDLSAAPGPALLSSRRSATGVSGSTYDDDPSARRDGQTGWPGAPVSPRAAAAASAGSAYAESNGTSVVNSIVSAGAVLVARNQASKVAKAGESSTTSGATGQIDAAAAYPVGLGLYTDRRVKPRSRAGRETSAYGWMTAHSQGSRRAPAGMGSSRHPGRESVHARRRRRRSKHLQQQQLRQQQQQQQRALRSGAVPFLAWSPPQHTSLPQRQASNIAGTAALAASNAIERRASLGHRQGQVRSEGQASERISFVSTGSVTHHDSARVDSGDAHLATSASASAADDGAVAVVASKSSTGRAAHFIRANSLVSVLQQHHHKHRRASSTEATGRREALSSVHARQSRLGNDGTLAPGPDSQGRRRAAMFTGEGGRADRGGIGWTAPVPAPRQTPSETGSRGRESDCRSTGALKHESVARSVLGTADGAGGAAVPSRRLSEPIERHRPAERATSTTNSSSKHNHRSSVGVGGHGDAGRGGRRSRRARHGVTSHRGNTGTRADNTTSSLSGRSGWSRGIRISTRASSYASSAASSLAAVGLLDQALSPSGAVRHSGTIAALSDQVSTSLAATTAVREMDSTSFEVHDRQHLSSVIDNDAAALLAASELFAEAAAVATAAEAAKPAHQSPRQTSQDSPPTQASERASNGVGYTAAESEDAPTAGQTVTVVRVSNGWGEEIADGDQIDAVDGSTTSTSWEIGSSASAITDLLEADGRISPQSVPGSPRAAAAALRHMALFSEETVVRARDALIAIHSAEAEALTQATVTSAATDDDNHCRAEQSALRSAVIASVSAFHPSFTHSRLSLLAGGHAVWWPDRSARVRRLLFRPGHGGASAGDSTAESSAALAWAAPGAEGQRGAAFSSSSSDGAQPSDAAGIGVSSEDGSATDASTGAGSAAKTPQFASARASLPVGLGAIAAESMLSRWGLTDGQSLERRVHSGLLSAPHLVTFVVETSAPTSESAPTHTSSKVATASASASACEADRAASKPDPLSLSAPVGVGLASFPAADLADAGAATIVASQFASSPIGSAAKSIGLYSDGSLLCGGVKIRRPRTIALSESAASSNTTIASFGIGDVVSLLLVPGEVSNGVVDLRAAFILHRQQLLVDGGETQVAHSELLFTGVSLASTPRKARHDPEGAPAGGSRDDQPISLRVRAAFDVQQLLDAGVIQRQLPTATSATSHETGLCICAHVRTGLMAFLECEQDSCAYSHVWTVSGTRIHCHA